MTVWQVNIHELYIEFFKDIDRNGKQELGAWCLISETFFIFELGDSP